MKLSKKDLIALIKESIDRNRKHYKGAPNRHKEFGDYLWPDLHIDYEASADTDIEENTYSEDDVLNQLMMYYQTDTFNTDTAMTNTAAQIIKDVALKRTYPFVFRQHRGLAYRGMALYKNDYERLYSNVPSSYKLTASERDKFNISPPDEKKYQDPITSFLSITSVPLINFYERMITKLGNVLSFSTDANKRKEWDYENTVLRDIPVTDEDYNFLHTREYQHGANPADKFSSFDDDLFPNYKSELGLSDWNTSPRAASYYAMEAARKLKSARPSQEVVPFMIICDPRKTSKGVFVDLYSGIKEQYPKLEKELLHLKKGDILLIGDADIERLTVFDNRGMGLKESSEINEMARHYFPKGVKNPSAENRKTGMTVGALAGSFYPAPYALGVLVGAVAGYFSGDLINLKKDYEEGKIYEQHPLHIANIRKNCDITNLTSIEKYIKDNGGIDEMGRPRVKYNIIDFNLFGKVSSEDKKLLLAMKNLGLFETKMQTAKSKLPFIGDK